MDNALITTKQPREETIKKTLQKAILRKKKTLADVAAKVEMLQVELDLIKHEYNVRIGGLLLKDNQLDLEIIQYRNIKSLMEQGLTYGEALREIEDYFYSDMLRMQKEQEEIEIEQEMLKNRHEVTPDIQEEIKVLWKKLIRKFHPDLVTLPSEKTKRDEIMKKINKAYGENDIEALQLLYSNVHVEEFHESTREVLEEILIDTENMIISLKQRFKDLKDSQWYAWKARMEKSKKTGEDIFIDLEKSLLNDIVRKIEIVNQLKKSVIPQEII